MNDENLDVDKLQADFRRTENELGPEVVERLRAARREAVAAADESPATRGMGWQPWAAIGAMASVAFAAAVLLQSPPSTLPMADETELAAAQEMELLEELEFVAWMVALEDEDLPTSG
jgi:hypothetical protein